MKISFIILLIIDERHLFGSIYNESPNQENVISIYSLVTEFVNNLMRNIWWKLDLKFFKNTNNLIFKKTETNYKILFLFLIVFFAMSFNIINYNHELGYDAAAHKCYVEVLPFALPTDQDTYEFFSPPLPYIFPSLMNPSYYCMTIPVCDWRHSMRKTKITWKDYCASIFRWYFVLTS